MNNLTITNKVIVGIGELLWDVFPSVKHIGGSPANFIYHINQLGASGIIVSSIGKDSQGNEIYDNLKRLGISGEYIQRNNHLPTGISRVQIDSDSTPSYKIDENKLDECAKIILGEHDFKYFCKTLLFNPCLAAHFTNSTYNIIIYQ